MTQPPHIGKASTSSRNYLGEDLANKFKTSCQRIYRRYSQLSTTKETLQGTPGSINQDRSHSGSFGAVLCVGISGVALDDDVGLSQFGATAVRLWNVSSQNVNTADQQTDWSSSHPASLQTWKENQNWRQFGWKRWLHRRKTLVVCECHHSIGAITAKPFALRLLRATYLETVMRRLGGLLESASNGNSLINLPTVSPVLRGGKEAAMLPPLPTIEKVERAVTEQFIAELFGWLYN